MIGLKNHFFTVLVLLVFGSTLKGQGVVYPGDVNNNGVVNHVDLLYLNSVLNQIGPARDEFGTEFEPFEINPWGFNIPGTTLDAAFADCNGDGFITQADVFAIDENYYMEHGIPVEDVFTEGEISSDPKLTLEFDYDIEDFLLLEITISNETEIEDLQGVAIKLKFDEEIFSPIGIIEYDDSWLGDESELIGTGIMPDFEFESTSYAIARKGDLGPATGDGVLLRAGFIIIGDVIALSLEDFETEVILESAKFVGPTLGEIPVVYDTVQIFIPQEEMEFLTNTKDIKIASSEVNIFPNPNNGQFVIDTKQININYMELYDVLGKKVNQLPGFNHQTQLDFTRKESGIYYLKLHSDERIFTKKIIIEN